MLAIASHDRNGLGIPLDVRSNFGNKKALWCLELAASPDCNKVLTVGVW